MTQARKVDLLYQKAHGGMTGATPAEKLELMKYRVGSDDTQLATRANISAYVKAVDSGTHSSFYDWCYNHKKGDRRRKIHKEDAMASDNKEKMLASFGIGWLTWGMALYWLAGGAVSAGGCAVVGGILAIVVNRFSRKYAMFTGFVLPLILAIVGYKLMY